MNIEERRSSTATLPQKRVIAIQDLRKGDPPRRAQVVFEDVAFPPVTDWILRGGRWAKPGTLLQADADADVVTLVSPAMKLEAGYVYVLTLSLYATHDCQVALSLDRFRSNAVRSVSGRGELGIALRRLVRRERSCRIVADLTPPARGLPVEVSEVALQVRRIALDCLENPAPPRTYRAEWSLPQRAVHWICKRSRFWNSIVSEVEMRTGREELLSLPQYMALCPTGQCNASCGFCSVTINRTGIIKKQLPYERMDTFLAPVSGTIRLFGIEGNGEPTLYEQFDQMLLRLTLKGAPVYLITNGERLSREQILLLLASPLDCINFSLNAATQETHRKIMRLKSFAAVLTNIRRLVEWRGAASNPVISVSIVVTHDNVAEMQRFLYLAEWVLRVDRIYIRPLSELASDNTTFEDFRGLVPDQVEIDNMLDDIEEYLRATPRRADIVVDPANFLAFQSGKKSSTPSVSGSTFHAPRARFWASGEQAIDAHWRLGTLVLRASSDQACEGLYVSAPTEVPRDRQLALAADVEVSEGSLTIAVLSEAGEVLAGRRFDVGNSNDARTELNFDTGECRNVVVALGKGAGRLAARISFGVTRTPARAPADSLKVPYAKRWETCMRDADVQWRGNRVRVRWAGDQGLYLLKSYSIACRPETELSLEATIAVDTGSLVVGILSEDRSVWVAQFSVARGTRRDAMVFRTGANQRVHVVLSSGASEPLDAEVDWLDQMEETPNFLERKISVRGLKLPPPERWARCAPDANIRWQGSSVALSYSGTAQLYLLMSERFPCVRVPDFAHDMEIGVSVRTGKLGIGFLSADRTRFIASSEFAPGQHQQVLRINPAGEQALCVVLFSCTREPLDAEVDWRDSLAWGMDFAVPPRLEELVSQSEADEIAERRLGSWDRRSRPSPLPTVSHSFSRPPGVPGHASGRCAQAASVPGLWSRALGVYRREGIRGVVDRIAWRLANRIPLLPIGGQSFEARFGPRVLRLLDATLGPPKIYCQKPWKDLHSYTVDGRMDVCCIATGPSQEAYALGNMFEQDFQDIWNGYAARRFRRTVNTDNKLLVCSRCTMANNYTRPF